MAQIVTATASDIPDSRIRLECSVAADEFERVLKDAAAELGKGLRVPGFRKGKVPAAVVISNLGREAVVDRAIKSGIATWYAEAVAEAQIDPVGEPSIEIGVIPADPGSPLPFTVEVGVRPPAKLGNYKGLKVPREEPDFGDSKIEEEIDRMRDRGASLETIDEPAAAGDTLVIDYSGSIEGEQFEGGTATGQTVELGSGQFIPGFEEGLIGIHPGETRSIDLTFPDDYQADQLAGRAAVFEIKATDIRRKRLPELDDSFAESMGHETVEALREDIRARMAEAEERRVEADFREACVEAAADNAKIELTEELIEGRSAEIWERTLRTLAAQGISREMYLQIAGKSEDELIAEAAEDAEKSLRRESVLEAIVAKEGLEPSEEAMLAALEHSAGHEGVSPAELLERIREDRREPALRRDLATRMAVDLIVDTAKPVKGRTKGS